MKITDVDFEREQLGRQPLGVVHLLQAGDALSTRHDAAISYTSKRGPFRAGCVCGWITKPFPKEADAVRAAWCHERDALLKELTALRAFLRGTAAGLQEIGLDEEAEEILSVLEEAANL